MITLDTGNIPSEQRGFRLRKVYYGHYDYEARDPHPLIRLKGKYLTRFGFKIGDIIKIYLEKDKITILK